MTTNPLSKKRGGLVLLIASLLFGLGHFSSIGFVIVTFFAGVIFNLNFMIYTKNLNYKSAYLSTFIIHFLSNLTVYFYTN
ncbi:MAG: type II CAAX prenyl endopeptidase Rce1 family protein [Flavobacteriales bacterium]